MLKEAKKKPTKKAAPNKGGRPSLYSRAIAEQICKAVIAGKYILDICKELEIDPTTLYEWRKTHEEFSQMYARAREFSAELDEDEVKRIARDGSGDYGFKEGKDGDGEGAFPVFIPENVQRSKLIVDTLKWSMAKRAPKLYADKVDHNHSGIVGVQLITNVPNED